MRSCDGCARSKPAPPVARSLEIISSLLESVTSTSMPVSFLNCATHVGGHVVGPGDQAQLVVLRRGDARHASDGDGGGERTEKRVDIIIGLLRLVIDARPRSAASWRSILQVRCAVAKANTYGGEVARELLLREFAMKESQCGENRLDRPIRHMDCLAATGQRYPHMRSPSLRSVTGFTSVLGGAAIAAAPPIASALQPYPELLPAFAGLLALLGLAVGVGLRSVSLRRLDLVLAEQKVENLRFHTAINNISQGLCFFDGQHRLIVCNDRYADLYKLPHEIVQPGTTLAEIVEYRTSRAARRDDAGPVHEVARVDRVADKPSEVTVLMKDGRTIVIHHAPMPDGGWVATHEDITEQRRVQAQIERMARHDALTGLPNRMLFRERLTEAVMRSKPGQPLAVLCIDLDRFKAVNDTLGHPVGDELLRAAAQRLYECVRETDLVARLGGDEFAIIQSGAAQPAPPRRRRNGWFA